MIKDAVIISTLEIEAWRNTICKVPQLNYVDSSEISLYTF